MKAEWHGAHPSCAAIKNEDEFPVQPMSATIYHLPAAQCLFSASRPAFQRVGSRQDGVERWASFNHHRADQLARCFSYYLGI